MTLKWGAAAELRLTKEALPAGKAAGSILPIVGCSDGVERSSCGFQQARVRRDSL